VRSVTATRTVSSVPAAELVLAVPPSGGVLVFDGWCGFCTRSVLLLLRWDRRGRVRALPLQGARVLDRTRLTRAQALHEVWWIGADGTRRGGAAAVAGALAAVTGVPVVALYRLPVLRWALDRGYRWVADHRRLFRGVPPWCQAHPEAGCDADTRASCSPP
jgi:predicted DCC family thiol-disulfide oxidoreductase YuxK